MKRRIQRYFGIFAMLFLLNVSFESLAQGVDTIGQSWQVNEKSEEKEIQTSLREVDVKVGWQIDGHGNRYFYNQDGTRYVGWLYEKGVWYYLDGENTEDCGLMLRDQVKKIGENYYVFDDSGAMKTGWVLRSEGWYYADSDGALAQGWRYIRGIWYYLDGANATYPGLLAENEAKQIGGNTYYFAVGGAMRTGWILCPEGWYYADASGARASGWRYVHGTWYYLDGANTEYPGLMIANCEKQLGDRTYRFLESGAMKTGWYYENGHWYYYAAEGSLASGWRFIGGAWYYLDPQNHNQMVHSGWKKLGNDFYFFYSGGAMARNWLALANDWYYLGGDGSMKTGWQYINGEWYYLYKENDANGGAWGVMARNAYIEGYYIGADGAMMPAEAARMLLKAQAYSSSTGYLMLVDTVSCTTAIFNGRAGNWSLVKCWKCSPGKASTPTVKGVFWVQSKGYYFDSGNARCYWYTQFYRDYLFHSVLYNKYSGHLADGRLGQQLSHGCIRLKIENAKWVYDYVPRGTKVVIY